MAKFEIIMPKLGESIIEATITKWLKKPGDTIQEDDSLAEIATDKVDSEIPSPVEGKLMELLFEEGETIPVGTAIAIIQIEGEDEQDEPDKDEKPDTDMKSEKAAAKEEETEVQPEKEVVEGDYSSASRFYSPLVKSIAKNEQIKLKELEQIPGSGKDNRVTKADILKYLEERKEGKTPKPEAERAAPASSEKASPPVKFDAPKVSAAAGDEVVEMDRMRRLIADHMVMSSHVSPHVTSFIEVDVTNIVNWRNKVKDGFQKRENQKITYTPIFIEAAAKTLRDYPMVNVSLDGYKIIKRKNINIGMATALPNGNLIVPVIKGADQINLVGLAKTVNDLANRARNNKLEPDEIQGGTFTVTNFGSFDSLTGTPIINQPQVAILGLGVIKKRPVVLETENGDVIAIRHIMILSLAYDHRIVDGALGGMYLKRIREHLENFDTKQTV
jgi:2-oxoglutarate dehydrogenase E2 component (dihydrolipoamide succinyltransferase)